MTPESTANILPKILFWIHAIIIFLPAVLGFFVTPLMAILLVVIHRLHVMLFDECLLSKWQRQVGGLQKNQNFLQQFTEKIFGRPISQLGSKVLDYCLIGSMVVISIIR